MKAIVATLFSIILFAGCAQTQNNAKIFEGSKKRPSANEAVATFAEGCFWLTQNFIRPKIITRNTFFIIPKIPTYKTCLFLILKNSEKNLRETLNHKKAASSNA